MTELSPAAQAVAWAYDNTPEKESGNHRYHWIAAALRAAADYTVPAQKCKEQSNQFDTGHWLARMEIRHQLIAIATELENK